jgi:hypothetical protein
MKSALKEIATTDFKKYLRDNVDVENNNKSNNSNNSIPKNITQTILHETNSKIKSNLKHTMIDHKDTYCKVRWTQINIIIYTSVLTIVYQVVYFWLKHKGIREQFLFEHNRTYALTILAACLSFGNVLATTITVSTNFFAFFFIVRNSYTRVTEKTNKEKEFKYESFIRIDSMERNQAFESFIKK